MMDIIDIVVSFGFFVIFVALGTIIAIWYEPPTYTIPEYDWYEDDEGYFALYEDEEEIGPQINYVKRWWGND